MKTYRRRLGRAESRAAKRRTEGEPVTRIVFRYVDPPRRCPRTGRFLDDCDREEERFEP
jgi:hypothetical protein